ncbi:hypothetical protein C8Q76DRAFT_843970, partial [Earliella scabrosa]
TVYCACYPATYRRPHWHRQRALFIFHPAGDDAFINTMHDPNPQALQQNELFRKVASYVDRSCAHQHRTAVFVFLANGSKMRVTRWDHSGVIFTPAFDYTDRSDLLCDLLRGFSLLTAEGQGLDPTAILLSPTDPDYAAMTEAAKILQSDLSEEEGTTVELELEDGEFFVFKFQRTMFADSLKDPTWPRYKLLVKDRNRGDRYFLVGKPCFSAPGIIGRGTRGYAALDCQTQRIVFLKDTWRRSYDGVEQEGRVLEKLGAAGVPNIPTLICHGDLGQETELSKHWATLTRKRKSRRNAPCPFQKLLHYRLVVAEVCFPLSEFKCGKQLISVVNDCILAHWRAVESPERILHRDISTANILILPTVVADGETGQRRVVWKGVLTDWELSESLSDEYKTDVQGRPPHIGTWQFISSLMLDQPQSPPCIADDLESFFYVIVYSCMRYFNNSLDSVSHCMSEFFDSATAMVHGGYGSGMPKRSALRAGYISFRLGTTFKVYLKDGTQTHRLSLLIRTLLHWFCARYALIGVGPSENLSDAAEESEIEDDDIARIRKIRKEQERGNVDELKERERNVTTHGAVWRLLDSSLRMSWPEDDKVGDRLVDDETGKTEPPTKRARKK